MVESTDVQKGLEDDSNGPLSALHRSKSNQAADRLQLGLEASQASRVAHWGLLGWASGNLWLGWESGESRKRSQK